MFNNITLIRTNNQTGKEIERLKVPIIYGAKEKYVTRLASDPDLTRETQITLPRMSFEITGLSYDPARKQNSLLKNVKGNTTTRTSSQYMGVPYDMSFELNVYARNIDDGTHIVEQILPYFNPDYTITMNSIPELGFLKDVPIILDTVTNDIQYEGTFDTVRYVNWKLTFTMKVYFYGPISTPKIIRKIDVNIFNDKTLQAGSIIRMNLESGNNGTFQADDFVYQGTKYETATAYGIVLEWNQTNNRLVIGGAQGQFLIDNTIRAVSTNASYNIASFDSSPLKLVNIHIEPSPNTAGPGDNYGYDTVITEWPETE